MDTVAEAGVAAHWQYKAIDKTTADRSVRARDWLSHLDEIQQTGTSEEFLESVKVDLFPDKIYVFTPKGDIYRFPKVPRLSTLRMPSIQTLATAASPQRLTELWCHCDDFGK